VFTGGLAPVLGVGPVEWLDWAIQSLAWRAPAGTFFYYDFNIRALLALVLVGLTCGAVGSLVVGGRMAFFSDALAHCAFASVSIGFLLFVALLAKHYPASTFWDWVTSVMVAFGLAVAYGIVAVRERTGLASDTVIGVFFAGALGLAALLRNVFQSRQLFNLEDFLFGNLTSVRSADLISLAVLALLTAVVLALIYNPLLLDSFNRSLALSRRAPTRLANYAFILVLALIVNLCLRFVGALLINALLVVPAATAVNLSRNLRQVFWLTVGLCLGASLAGQWLSWEVSTRLGVPLGLSGTIILISVLLFTLSALFGPWRRERWRGPAAQPPPPAPLAPAALPADNNL
jgi:zinc transport system permease protein